MNTPRQKPGLCGLLSHLVRRLFFTEHYRLVTLVGLLFVLLNVPIGWGSAALFSLIALHRNMPFFYTIAGLCYAGSWLLLGLGIVMAGRDTVRAFRARIPRGWHAWRRLRSIRGKNKST